MTTPQTDAQRSLAALAAALADANVDAAEYLAQALAEEIRWNAVTQRAEVGGPGQ